MPGPREVKAVRRQAAYYRSRYDCAARHPVLAESLGGQHQAIVGAAVRRASVRTSLFRLYRDSLQRHALWFAPPLFLVGSFATSWLVHASPHPPSSVWPAVASGVAGVVLAVVTLVIAVALDRTTTHFWASVVLAAGAVAAIVLLPSVPPALRGALAASLVPGVMYLMSGPLVVIAYLVARRLGGAVDPRARIVVGLLECAAEVSSAGALRYQMGILNQIGATLERIARIAENDLPRVLGKRAQDRVTQAWLREQAHLIASRVRQSKQVLVFPDDKDALPREIGVMLLHACTDDWEWFTGGTTAPPVMGRLRRAAQHLGASIVLIAAGVALPLLLQGPLDEAAGGTLRAVLLVAGVLALVPLPRDTLRRIPDTIVEVAQP